MLDPQIPLLPFFITDQSFHRMGPPSESLVEMMPNHFPGFIIRIVIQNGFTHLDVRAVMGVHRPHMGLIEFNITILRIDGKKRNIQPLSDAMRKLTLTAAHSFKVLQLRNIANHADEAFP